MHGMWDARAIDTSQSEFEILGRARDAKADEKRRRYFLHTGGQNVVSPALSYAAELARVKSGCEVGSKLIKML